MYVEQEVASADDELIAGSAALIDASDVDWGFSLDDLDPNLMVDESETPLTAQEEGVGSQVLQIEDSKLTFGEWLASTIPVDDELELSQTLPAAFGWAREQAVQTTKKLESINLDGLQSVGSSLGSLLGSLGSCGPICLHGLANIGNVASSTSSFSGVGGLGGLGGEGEFSTDNGMFSLSAPLDQVANLSGLSRSGILSGKYSNADILARIVAGLGEGLCNCAFGLLDAMAGWLIPTSQTA